MTRFSAIDLSAYPIGDILDGLSFEATIARDRTEFTSRWDARRLLRPDLPAIDTILLESDPASVVMEVGAYRETTLGARINDLIRSLSLAGALGRALDHIGMTYYRATRRTIIPADGSIPAIMEDDESYRQRLALAPESWSTAGPVGAYLFRALTASGDVLDVAVYSEDEGTCLAPRIRVVVLSRTGTGAASAGLLATVLAALNRSDIRPMGDLITVETAVPLPFDLTVTLKLRSGASTSMVIEAARERIRRYCSGFLRWVGEGETGPVWLIGRTLRVESIAGVAMGGDPNILEADVTGGDINPPHASYTEAALAGVGTAGFVPLPAPVTAHLFSAPRLGTLSVTYTLAQAGWSA